MSSTPRILTIFLFGLVSIHALAIKPRLGVDLDVYEKFVCNGKPDGEKLLVPGTCTQYFECQSGEIHLKTCENPTKYFDSASASCVSTSDCIEDTKDCGDKPSTPKPVTTQPPPCKTTTSKKADAMTIPTSTSQPPISSMTPAPTTPAPKTPIADTETIALRPCEEKRHEQEQQFLEELQSSGFFGAAGRPCETPGGSCSGLPNGIFIANKMDCNKYKICFSGCGADIYCPRGKHFNAATRNCDTPEKAQCKV